MVLSYWLGFIIWRYQVQIPVGPDLCHRGCAYTVLQTVQRPEVYSSAYGNVHFKKPLKSFEIRVGHSPGFGLSTVAILPWLCRKGRNAIFTHTCWCVDVYRPWHTLSSSMYLMLALISFYLIFTKREDHILSRRKCIASQFVDRIILHFHSSWSLPIYQILDTHTHWRE